MTTYKTTLSCWNNFPSSIAFIKRPESYKEVELAKEGTTLARGLGRSYGDAALNTDNTVLLMERMNRFIAFDEEKGLLRAEAGTSLAEILEVFTPRGWFPPVTPGTKHVTLGGCFAADVHGKNHHVDGSFSRYVTEIELILADGTRKRCTKQEHADLFWATAGGMGLTGIITEITLQLKPIENAYICVSHRVATNIEHLLSLLTNPACDDKYSVAWIDCLAKGAMLGRGILMTGHHAKGGEMLGFEESPMHIPSVKTLSIPCYLPKIALNYWSIKAFNHLYFKAQSRKQTFLSHANQFFYPLDRVSNWNRIYGKSGFIQYQCVVPLEHAKQALPVLLNKLADSQKASFLAVIKRFGPEGPGYLSFAREGITLALDIPLSDPSIFTLLNQLDAIVLGFGGRIYLAKDARLKPEVFRLMYPRFNQWQQIKTTHDPNNRFTSDLSRRLLIGRPI